MENVKKAMTLTYRVGDGLYVNLTNRCTNRCDFCIRKNADGAYGSDSLWLLREPTVSEVLTAIDREGERGYSELVFCGYGEPTCRLDELIEIAREVKKIRPETKIRVNTNGHSTLIWGYDTAPKFSGIVDTVSISLNAASAKRYAEICHPVYGEMAFSAILDFAKNVKKYVQNTLFSVVGETLSDEELLECHRIARECGVQLRVRDYISS